MKTGLQTTVKYIVILQFFCPFPRRKSCARARRPAASPLPRTGRSTASASLAPDRRAATGSRQANPKGKGPSSFGEGGKVIGRLSERTVFPSANAKRATSTLGRAMILEPPACNPVPKPDFPSRRHPDGSLPDARPARHNKSRTGFVKAQTARHWNLTGSAQEHSGAAPSALAAPVGLHQRFRNAGAPCHKDKRHD